MPRSSPVNGPFAASSKKEWEAAAKQELGADAIQKLTHNVDSIVCYPYYDQSDLPASLDFQLPPSQNESLEPRSWSNVCSISVNSAPAANHLALHALNSGADGILFKLQDNPDADLLLDKIELPYCQTSFLADTGHEKFIFDCCKLVQKKKINPSTVTGTIFWKPGATLPEDLMQWFNGWSQYRTMGIVMEDDRSPTTRIATLLAKAVKQIDTATSQGCTASDALRSIAFLVFVGTGFFQEIATLKALRKLWLQIAQAYEAGPHLPFIHAVSSPWENSMYEPHGNMVKGTFCTLSAVLGGCDALTVEALDPRDSTAIRVALNTSSITLEEAHLGKVADPTAGSYFLEHLVDGLAREAWKKFQALTSS